VDTTYATTAPTDPTSCGYPVSNTVWFSYTATESQRLKLDAGASVVVLTDLGSGPTAIGCGPFDAVAGRTYFFMVWGVSGPLQVTLRPGQVMTVGIDPTGLVDRQGVAVVSGTLTCTPGIANTELDVTLRQRISKTLVIVGSTAQFGVLCPTTPAAWSAVIVGSNGPFRKGQAEVFVTGYDCTGYCGKLTEGRSLVDLRRK
jgi:hypothetical protein